MSHLDPQDDPIRGDAAPDRAPDRDVDAERRAAVLRLGALAAYTAPALLATMSAAKAQRASFVIG